MIRPPNPSETQPSRSKPSEAKSGEAAASADYATSGETLPIVASSDYGSRGRAIRFAFAVCCAALLLALIAFVFNGKTGVEKTLTKLVMPVGFLWLLLTSHLALLIAAKKLQAVILPGLAWGILVISGTPVGADFCTWWLETRIPNQIVSKASPLDTVIVLGGGTTNGMHRAQAASSGDRVLYAAQLYHQGLTTSLITTGDALPGASNETMSPSRQTIEIWTALGIPASAIKTLPGYNTYKEIESVAEAMQSELRGKRVGLLTSALHLPRAMRLANARGIVGLTPLAADYRWNNNPKSVADFIPNAAALSQFSSCQHEIMAWFLGR